MEQTGQVCLPSLTLQSHTEAPWEKPGRVCTVELQHTEKDTTIRFGSITLTVIVNIGTVLTILDRIVANCSVINYKANVTFSVSWVFAHLLYSFIWNVSTLIGRCSSNKSWTNLYVNCFICLLSNSSECGNLCDNRFPNDSHRNSFVLCLIN